MKVRAAGPVALAGLLLAGCGGGAQAHWQPPTPQEVRVVLEDANGAEVGHANLVQMENGVEIEATFEGLEPGFKGFHIHETGICDADDSAGPFESAGGHYAPGGSEHPHHAGDLPSLLVTMAGTAELTAMTDRVSLDDLVDPGTALIVHTGPDNFANLPERYLGGEGIDQQTLNTGDAGDRAACGVIGDSA